MRAESDDVADVAGVMSARESGGFCAYVRFDSFRFVSFRFVSFRSYYGFYLVFGRADAGDALETLGGSMKSASAVAGAALGTPL